MTGGAINYAIYDKNKNQLVARISAEGVVHGEGNPGVEEVLKTLLQEEIVIREHQIDYDPLTDDGDFDPYPAEKMCYFNIVTLRPGDPSYLKAFMRRLPYITHYEARISN
jgi:hypothetical protein